ncbi:MAG: hypothetical protein NZ847_03090 [Acidobacteria bacterium]|nr:hypothetical protein [Acidobacteriota bacterium]
MMSEATLLESRVDKLEQDNRRLKLTVGALLLVLAAVPLIGGVMPEQIPEMIQARAFHVIDENGVDRVRMSDLGIRYLDENGTGRVAMNDVGIGYQDENGDIRAAVDADGIWYMDENRTIRAAMSAKGVGVTDDNGTIRARVEADGIGYWDENENLVWRTPER